MNVRRLEIDFQKGTLTVDADVNEEFGREFEFDLATLREVQPLADEIARRSQLAVIARLRTWSAAGGGDGGADGEFGAGTRLRTTRSALSENSKK